MTPDRRKELATEYAMLQTHYEAYDGRALTIKSWGTGLLAGGLGLGFKDQSVGFLAATALGAACLWALEAFWKSFQYSNADRIRRLESAFRDDEDDFPPFQIFTSWGENWQRQFRNQPRAFLPILGYPFVFLPYLPIILAAGIGGALIAAS